ncbi:unnamed protein product [Spirodela intermedia]|uniref:Uncharacterized protein n=1 Tax=Spirodela intermedia TaxID=51605 RepID=A0A7I8L0N5_SPIIN|nr:unnamed protein product [Spirodela intermedia]
MHRELTVALFNTLEFSCLSMEVPVPVPVRLIVIVYKIEPLFLSSSHLPFFFA